MILLLDLYSVVWGKYVCVCTLPVAATQSEGGGRLCLPGASRVLTMDL